MNRADVRQLATWIPTQLWRRSPRRYARGGTEDPLTLCSDLKCLRLPASRAIAEQLGPDERS